MRNRALGSVPCSCSRSSSRPVAGSAADIKKVGLVTDVGTLEDKSFNEASWVGAQAAPRPSAAPPATS